MNVCETCKAPKTMRKLTLGRIHGPINGTLAQPVRYEINFLTLSQIVRYCVRERYRAHQ